MKTSIRLAVALLLSAPLLSAPVLAQDEQAGDDRPLPDLAAIKSSLTELRELEFKQEVPAEVQTLEGWGEYLDATLEASFPEEKQKDLLDGLMRLGLILEPIDLEKEIKDALLSQAGAYYDPKTKKFYYLMIDMHMDALKTIAAHELVHALQDQHFGLNDLMTAFEEAYQAEVRNDDSILAFRMLVEGEATYVHTLWQVGQMGMDLAENPDMERMQLKMMADMDIGQLVQMAQQMQGENVAGEGDAIAKAMREMDKIPPYILHPLYAAYMQGAYFTMSIRHDGGWKAVGKAYDALPKSAEQTIHPEKYLEAERDDPTPIELAVSPTLTDAGWTRIDSAVNGEFYLGLILRNFDIDSRAAKRAVEGWDGDVYQAYRSADGDVALRLLTTWDSESDARQYYDAMVTMLQRRYSDERISEDVDAGVATLADEKGAGHGLLKLRGREVLFVDGLPEETVEPVMGEMAAVAVKYVK